MWSRSRRLGLETVSRRTQRLVSSRTKFSMSRSRLGLESPTSRSRLGLGYLGLVHKPLLVKQNAEISSTPWSKIETIPSCGLPENLPIPETTAHHLPNTTQQAPVWFILLLLQINLILSSCTWRSFATLSDNNYMSKVNKILCRHFGDIIILDWVAGLVELIISSRRQLMFIFIVRFWEAVSKEYEFKAC